MKSIKVLSIAATALMFLAASSARADDMYIWAEEVAGDVVFYFEGSIDLTDFPSGTPSGGTSTLRPQGSIALFVDPAGMNLTSFSGVLPNSSQRNFGTGGPIGADSEDVPDGGFGFDDFLYVPLGYTSQAPISGSMTFLSTDFATLKVDPTPFTFDTTVGDNTIHMFTDPSTLPPVLPPANPNAFANASEKSALFRGIKGLQKKAKKLKKKGKKTKAKKLKKKIKKLKKQLAALG